MSIRKALVPVDGSEVSVKAVRLACQLAVRQGWEVLLLHVLEHPPMPGFAFPDDVRSNTLHDLEEHGREVLARAEGSVRDAGVEVSSKLVEGSAPEMILAELGDGCCGIVVLGSTGAGRGRLGALLFGSVAEQVIRGAKVPVLLVKGDTVVE